MTEEEAKASRPCRGCGAPITIATQPDGKLIPLDRRAPVYRLEPDLTGSIVAVRDAGAFVSHFCTCPKADEFSKAKRAAGAQR